MATTPTRFDLHALQNAWQAFDAATRLRSIHTDAEYDDTVALLQTLLDAVGDREDHALAGLLDVVGDLVSIYEQKHHAIAPVEFGQALAARR